MTVILPSISMETSTSTSEGSSASGKSTIALSPPILHVTGTGSSRWEGSGPSSLPDSLMK